MIKWQMIQPAASAVKQNTPDTILDNISKFETDDFVSDDSDSSLKQRKITVTLNDGSNVFCWLQLKLTASIGLSGLTRSSYSRSTNTNTINYSSPQMN